MIRKRVLQAVAAAAALVVLAAGARGAEFRKTKIAVIDFQLQGEGFSTPDMGKIVAEWLITELVKAGRFDVIERRLLEKVLSEQELGLTGVIDSESASKLGRVLGARVVISGTVMKLPAYTEVNARLIDVESGSIIAAEKVKSETTTRLEHLIELMAEKIIKDFPLEGYVVARTGDYVSIDLGKMAGVREGMRFVVFKEGEVIKHPKTGEVLDISQIRVGEVEVTGVKEKIATARIVSEEEGRRIEYGDMVRSVKEETKVEVERPAAYQPPARESRPEPVPAALHYREIDRRIRELEEAKARGRRPEKIDIKRLIGRIQVRLKKDYTSPELYFHLARVYRLVDSYRKAQKTLVKALYYDARYLPALALQGEMNYEASRRADWRGGALRDRAYEAYTAIATSEEAGPSLKALAHLRLGDILWHIDDDREKARRHWEEAARFESTPHAAKARARLRETETGRRPPLRGKGADEEIDWFERPEP
ncbi:MAG TPA: hypothetical protein ENJ37_00645 [Deltaproteobacteria bacterium]|nr:hypothetical protein [Deltaproteobacteria bacterium]